MTVPLLSLAQLHQSQLRGRNSLNFESRTQITPRRTDPTQQCATLNLTCLTEKRKLRESERVVHCETFERNIEFDMKTKKKPAVCAARRKEKLN